MAEGKPEIQYLTMPKTLILGKENEVEAKELGNCFGEARNVNKCLADCGCSPAGPMTGVYYQTKPKFRVFAGFPVKEEDVEKIGKEISGFEVRTFGEVEIAQTVHKGPYEGLPGAWHALYDAVEKEDGKKLGFPGLEVYSVMDMSEPAKCETILQGYMETE